MIRLQTIFKLLLVGLFQVALLAYAQDELMLPEGPPPEDPDVDKAQTLEGGIDQPVVQDGRVPEQAFRFPSAGDNENEKNIFKGTYDDDLDQSMPEPVVKRQVQLSENPVKALSQMGAIGGDGAPAVRETRKAVSWTAILGGGMILVVVIAILMIVLSRPPKEDIEEREDEHL